MSTSGKPLRADAQRNREALLAKAREVFEAGEFFDLRFDDFARLAGVGTGTLYRHFPTREALAEAVYHEEVVALCERAHHLRATASPLDALTTFLREMVGYLHAKQGLARTLATLMAADSLAEGSRALEEAVTGLVDAAARAGAIRADVGAGPVMMALHGIGAAHERPDWRAEADGVITLVLDGLVQRSQPSSPKDSPAR